MLKALGAIIILISGTAAGVTFANKLFNRVDFFQSLLRFITFTENEIKYSTDSLANIIVRFDANGKFKKFLHTCASKMECGETFINSFEYAVSQIPNEVGLLKSDIELIKCFGSGLGISDSETQISHCKLYKNLVSEKLLCAIDDKKTKSKLYITLGVSISIALILIII